MELFYKIVDQIFSKIDLGIVISNTAGKVTFMNNAAEDLIGLKIDEFNEYGSNKTLKHTYFDEFGKPILLKDQLSRHILYRENKHHNFSIKVRENNISRWIKGTSYTLDRDGYEFMDYAALTTVYDITKSKKAEKSSRRNQEFLQLIIDYIPQQIYWKDIDLIYRGCNQNFARAAGFDDPENIIGKSDYDLSWTKEEAENCRIDDQSVLDSTKPALHIIETQLQTDKKQKWFDTNRIPFKTPKGKIKGILGTLQDITEIIESKQKIEKMLRNENKKLEKMVQEKTVELETTMTEFMNREKLASLGSLVAGVSHEINTPLGVALSASSYLTEQNENAYKSLNDGTLTKEVLMDYMKTVEESTEILNINLYRAAELVKSFKAMSVSQNSGRLFHFDLRAYINSVIVALKHEYKKSIKSIEIIPDEEIWISADPSPFSQIITNFVMNSLKHAFDLSDTGKIIITLKVTENDLSIRFEDNGKGIAKDNLLRIFDPFYTTAVNNGGSGLGLSIVYNIVTDKLKGIIDCQSLVGKGTTFIINIPLGDIVKHG